MRLDPFSHLDEKLTGFVVGLPILLLWWALTLRCRPEQPSTIPPPIDQRSNVNTIAPGLHPLPASTSTPAVRPPRTLPPRGGHFHQPQP